MIVVEFRVSALSSPSIGGLAGRAPTLMKMLSAPSWNVAAVQAHLQFLRAGEGGLAPQQVQALGPLDSPLAATPKTLHDVALALAYPDHVHGYRAAVDAVIRRTPIEVCGLCPGDHGLGWGAPLVDAGTADVLALYNRRSAPGSGQGGG